MARGGRNVPGLQERFALKGKLLPYYHRGQLVVNNWPKPFGPARSPAQQDTQTAFKRFQRAVKFFQPQQIITAMETTANTGMYPRDILMAAALGTNVMLAYDEPGAQPMIGDGIEKFTADGTTGTHTFSNIPQGYSSLMLDVLARSSFNGNQDTITVQFNGDTGAHYDQTAWNRNGTFSAINQTFGLACDVTSATSPALYPGGGRILIPGYANTAFYKYLEASGADVHTHAANQMWMNFAQTWWQSQAAINSISLHVNGLFIAGSTVTLYGLF